MALGGVYACWLLTICLYFSNISLQAGTAMVFMLFPVYVGPSQTIKAGLTCHQLDNVSWARLS